MKKLALLSLVLLFFMTSGFAEQWGLASWYGGDFNGKKTANGEIFNTNEHTAAHNTLPFNSIVKVTNLYNLKTTVVRINDRGPFRKGRIIDLSKAAAQDLDMLDSGVIPVRIEVMEKNQGEDEVRPVEPVKPIEPVAEAKMYRIQVGAFREPANAERTKRIINAKNLSVVIEITKNGFHRVHVDKVPENSLKHTEKILHDLGFHDFIVRELQ
jgi:rare lipoprotein A